ncbi:MAG: lactate dehydrogenase [SAR202 cluster bacterium]|nr:lactate dehydrogenase [SAR202 cluster bacterium]
MIQQAPAGWNVVLVDPAITPEGEQLKLVADADFIWLYGGKPSDAVLRAGKKVKLLQLSSAGYDNINVALAGELGIPVANASGTNAEGVAELAVTLMLSVYRHLIRIDNETRNGQWLTDNSSGTNSFEVLNKTVGIVGLGNIGGTVAKLLRGFDPKLLYYDVVAKPEIEKRTGATRTGLDELLEQSDIVTLHVPLTSRTRHMIGKRELGLMKPSAILINTCRGPVVDEAALHDALVAGRIWGAGLDVFEIEPVLKDNPILKLENVVVAPHAAGKTAESYPRRARFSFDNMQRVLSGRPALNIVTPS